MNPKMCRRVLSFNKGEKVGVGKKSDGDNDEGSQTGIHKKCLLQININDLLYLRKHQHNWLSIA